MISSCININNSNTFGQDLSDDSNADSDESTDKYIDFSWGRYCLVIGQEEQIHIRLRILNFKVAEGADLTEASTSIRIEVLKQQQDITSMVKTLI